MSKRKILSVLMYICIVAVVCNVVACNGKQEKDNQLSVMSYNIRAHNDADGNSIRERTPRLQTVIENYSPDLIGFQEFNDDWETYVLEVLQENYGFVLEYRGGFYDEASPIFYKKDVFKLLDSGVFWYSDTPDVATACWGSRYNRICTWAKLEIIKSGTVFYYFNTHMDDDEERQLKSISVLDSKRKEICGDAPLVITGDFNMVPTSTAYERMSTLFTDVNKKTENSSQPTYTNYGKDSALIDYCFVSPDQIQVLDYKVADDLVDGNYVSDHFGIYAELMIASYDE